MFAEISRNTGRADAARMREEMGIKTARVLIVNTYLLKFPCMFVFGVLYRETHIYMYAQCSYKVIQV